MIAGITGVKCDGTNGRQWANAIATLLRNRDLRQAMGTAARRYSLGRRWDRALEPLFATYRSVSAARTISPIRYLPVTTS